MNALITLDDTPVKIIEDGFAITVTDDINDGTITVDFIQLVEEIEAHKVKVSLTDFQVIEENAIDDIKILMLKGEKGDAGSGSGGGSWGEIDGNITNQTDLMNLMNNKVDKVAGKGLSTNDYSTAEKAKLASIATNAEANIVEIIKVNNVALIPDANKSVNISVPSMTINDIKSASMGVSSVNDAHYLNWSHDSGDITNLSISSDGTQLFLAKYDASTDTWSGTATFSQVTVDNALSATSQNPVQNRVINSAINGKAPTYHQSSLTIYGKGTSSAYGHVKLSDSTDSTSSAATGGIAATPKAVSDALRMANEQTASALSGKVDKVVGKGLSTEDYTTTEKNKLSDIESGAEVNQNAFSEVVVDAVSLTADSKTDTLELVAGSNVTLTPDVANKTITIASSGGGQSNVQSDWAQTDTTADDYIKNKPTIPSVDSALSSTSENPVQNKVIKTALDGKANVAQLGLYRHTSGYSEAGDIDSITNYMYTYAVNNGLVELWTVCRCDPSSNSVFGNTGGFDIFCRFSSANYGYGFMIADNNANMALWRRAGGVNHAVPMMLNSALIKYPSLSKGSNYANGGNTCYYLVGNRVHVHISVQGLTANANNTIFTLPSGYRPKFRIAGAGTGTTMSATDVATVNIYADGNVNVRSNSQYAFVDIEYDLY